ncbi:bifunctional nuclease family protein [Mycetocola manganoxydans]|uniref:Bifunctional nuclease family protein n=1 Tax=Mycetocola manganoxydans TaxID=699879 RepID=A0A3L6ZQU2_9MICO|nr:bifunctional nuclease family protein [Mycetocola manganoxydans]RLP70217.1 bifunctional nuclease family protein [Mycetocola manganoxydans]GHD49320.1 hypothetical protein GCM10008097_22050 [Mycetocola manganoxydans]
MVQVHIVGVALDSRGQPLILLKPIDAVPGVGLVLPIWIGAQEATSILIAVEGNEAPRPLSHDLMKTLMETLHASVERVEITRIDDGTFYAELTLHTREGVIVLDCRPSDAIAIAARTEASIWVNDGVLEEAGIAEESTVTDASGTGGETADAPDEEERVADFRRFLDEVDPEDFQG